MVQRCTYGRKCGPGYHLRTKNIFNKFKIDNHQPFAGIDKKEEMELWKEL